MLKNFKNSKSAKRVENAKKQKAIAVEKKKVLNPPSDSESDSSDSEYEEILISSINGQPKKPDPKPQKPEPQPEPNHANHFTEADPVEIKKSAPIPIAKKKSKSQKVVIKKYYQQRPAKQVAVEDNEPRPAPHVMPSYIGISSNAPQHALPKGRNPHSTMSSRILNW